MAYYEIAKLRERTIGSSADTSLDPTLNNFGTQADNQINDELYLSANKYSKLQQLPALPLTGAMLAQSIKDAATDRATGLYFLWEKATEIAKFYLDSSKAAVMGYVQRLEQDSEVWSDNV